MISKHINSMHRHHYVSLALLLLQLIWVVPVRAAVCVPRNIPEADFVWQAGTQSLPANAKGALFKIAPLRPIHTHRRLNEENLDYLTTLFRDLPPPLLASHFTVQDQKTNIRLTPTVTHMRYKEHFLSPYPYNHYFRYLQVDAKAFSCGFSLSYSWPSSLFDAYCDDLGDQIYSDLSTQIERDLKKSTDQLMQDTQLVKKGTGLFRIGVEEGFEPGHTYTIQFLGMPGYWNLDKTQQSYRAPQSLTITIDKQNFDLNSFKKLGFVAKRDPKNKKEKNVFYDYNAMQSRYQDAFYSLITVGGEGYVRELEYLPEPKPDCYLTPYLWHKYFNQSGIFALSNLNPNWDEYSDEVQGRIGFFEVDDAVFETEETKFKVK